MLTSHWNRSYIMYPIKTYQAIFSNTYKYNKSQFKGTVKLGGECWIRRLVELPCGFPALLRCTAHNDFVYVKIPLASVFLPSKRASAARHEGLSSKTMPCRPTACAAATLAGISSIKTHVGASICSIARMA